MCGIVGVIGNGIVAADLKIYKQMLIADTFRGAHSTGQFSVGSTAAYDYFKRAVPGWHFMEHKKADSMITCVQRAIIGHNRYATQGAINSVNAHPFDTGEVVGVHNGSLFSTSNLLNDTMYDVDSEALLNDIAANGIEHTAGIAKGAFALVWYDSRDRKLRILRNEQRTLAIYLHPNRDVAYIASEIDMLRWIIARNDNTFDEQLLMPIEAGEMWEFDTSRAAKMTEAVEYKKVKCANEYPPVQRGNWQTGYNGYGGGYSKKSGGVLANPSGGTTKTTTKARTHAQLLGEYKIHESEKIIADFTHITTTTTPGKTRGYNLSGKVLYPDRLAGLGVSAFTVPEDIGGAGIFEGPLVSMFEDSNGKVRVVMRGSDVKYLCDDKEVLEFEKKTNPAQV